MVKELAERFSFRLYMCFQVFELIFNSAECRTHVWGHFCLCYEGQKLLNDKAYIRDLRIKDGDQVGFLFFFFPLPFTPFKASTLVVIDVLLNFGI